MNCNETKTFLKSLCDELSLSIAYFCFEPDKEIYLILKKNNSNTKGSMKKILFGENDKEKDLLSEILPELVESVKSQGWK